MGGLAPSVNEDALRQYFEQFGQVEDAVVMYDHDNKRPRGFGFITFAEEDSVDKVFAHGAMQNIHDKPIEIKPAVPRDQMPPVRRTGQPLIPGRGESPAAYQARGAAFPFGRAGFPAQAAYGQRAFPSIGGQRGVAGSGIPGSYRGNSPQAGASGAFGGGLPGQLQQQGRFPGGMNPGRFAGLQQQAAAYGMYNLGQGMGGFPGGNVSGGQDMSGQGMYNFANLQQQFQQQQQQGLNGFQNQVADMAGKLGGLNTLQSPSAGALGGGFSGFPAAATQQPFGGGAQAGSGNFAAEAGSANFGADSAAAAAAAAFAADAAAAAGAVNPLQNTSPLGTTPDFSQSFSADGSRFPGAAGGWPS